jgi:uncharacterized protein with HEPN domain
VRDDRERLRDILDAIDRVEQYTRLDRRVFDSSEIVQTAVIYQLQVIGEAANQVSRGVRREMPDLSWTKIIGMRNILVHRYFGVDLDAVWTAVEIGLPPLKRGVQALLRDLEEAPKD